MKKYIAVGCSAAVAFLICCYLIANIVHIGVGEVGVVYNAKGGVEDTTLSSGWHLTGPTEYVKKFSVSNEQLVLSKDKREGSKDDDSFKVSTSDDSAIAISFQMSYYFIPEKVVSTYKSFKGMDGEDIVENRVKTVLKSDVSEVTHDYSLMDIYSGDRAAINAALTEYLNELYGDKYGICVTDASIIDTHPGKTLKKAIEKRVTALQEKEQAKAEQEKVKVEKETEQLEAEADAKIAVTKAEAEAKANKLKADSITQNLIDWELALARYKHGWVTVEGASSTVVTTEAKSSTEKSK